MATGSKESNVSSREGFPRLRGKKRKLFYKETKRLVDQLSEVSGEEWVEAIADYADENELHLQIFPERDALHKKIIAKCASELGSFFKDLVKKYLELYASEWGASAALVFAFIGYVGRTLSGETKSSDLWLSIIGGEDKETARHIGNMYGLALMYEVDQFIEKQKRTGTADDEAFCQSAEPDDYTCVSLISKNILTPRRRRMLKTSPSQSTGHKYTAAVTSTTSLISASTRISKNCLNTTTQSPSRARLLPSTRNKKSREYIISSESAIPTPTGVPSMSDTFDSAVSASSVASTSSAIGSFPVRCSVLVSDIGPFISTTCITDATSSNPSSPNSPTVLDSSDDFFPSTRTSTRCTTSRVTRTSAKCATARASKTSKWHITSTATDTPLRITSTYSMASTRQKTPTQPSGEGKASAVPESFIMCVKPAEHRTSARHKTRASPVSSTRSGRIPKKKVVLDL